MNPPLSPSSVPKVLEKSKAIPLVSLRAFVAYKKSESYYTENCSTMGTPQDTRQNKSLEAYI